MHEHRWTVVAHEHDNMRFTTKHECACGAMSETTDLRPSRESAMSGTYRRLYPTERERLALAILTRATGLVVYAR